MSEHEDFILITQPGRWSYRLYYCTAKNWFDGGFPVIGKALTRRGATRKAERLLAQKRYREKVQ